MQSRLAFDIGGVSGNVYFDNILLRKGNAVNTGTNLRSQERSASELDCFPNPFSSFTNIKYNLEKPGWISIKILSMNGQEIESIQNGFMQEGEHNFRWENSKLTPGIYLCQLQTDYKIENKRILLVP